MIIVVKKGETVQIFNNFSYYLNDATLLSMNYQIKKFQSIQTWVPITRCKCRCFIISKATYCALHIPSFDVRFQHHQHQSKDYLSKINGEKIIVFESSTRISIFDLLLNMLNHCGGFRSFEFGEQKTFEHDLVGLTLIEQTDLPLIIKVNPNHYQTLNRLIDVVCPHHIVIGDIFRENQYLELRNQKLILGY